MSRSPLLILLWTASVPGCGGGGSPPGAESDEADAGVDPSAATDRTPPRQARGGSGGKDGGAGGTDAAARALGDAAGGSQVPGPDSAVSSAGGSSGSDASPAVTADGPGASPGGAGGGGSLCAAGLAFCDDFDGYPAGAPPGAKWQVEGKAAAGFAMTIDDTRAFSGTKALRIRVDYTGNSYAEIYMGAKSGVTGNTAYARFMMYQTAWTRPHPSEPPGIHDRIFFIGNVSVDLDFSPSVFTMEVAHDIFGPASHSGPTPILNKWICIKGQFGPTLSLTVDGKVISAPPGGGTGLDALRIGMSSYRKFSTDVWIDDVVVDTKPVECPADTRQGG